MKLNRDFFKGAAVAVVAILCVAATVTTKYRGDFIGGHYGLGTGLTNASGVGYAVTSGSVGYSTLATNAVNATNLWSRLSPTNLPVGIATSNYVGTFSGDGSLLTGLVDTNFNANLYAASTNASINNSLAISVTGVDDGIRLAVRGNTNQANDVFQVQTRANALVLGVSLDGHLSWGNAPTNSTASTNTALYLVVTNAGVGYAIRLHSLVPD